MLPHEAFLQAILEEPDDDAPRLVFADWLDDQGEAERAEFIRLQCLLADLPAYDSRQADLERRAALLLGAHEERWTRGLRGRVAFWAFARGFVEEVGAPTAQFVEQAPALFQLAPLRTVHLWHHNAIDLLAGCHLHRLRHLDLSGSPLTDEDVLTLAGVAHLDGLRGLNLGSTGIGDAAVHMLAHARGLAGLNELYLSSNQIGNAGARALATTPQLQRLTALYLDANPIPDADSRALLRRRFGSAVHF
jgi:uncharacterized protein (TIGR02996 family)